jgi:hypothetical protein
MASLACYATILTLAVACITVSTLHGCDVGAFEIQNFISYSLGLLTQFYVADTSFMWLILKEVKYITESGQPLWSSGQSSWLHPDIRVRFPELPDFLRNSGSGTEVHSAS